MVQLVANGGKVMFIGTKRQAQDVIQAEADRCGMWYVNQRWLGGTLTNFQTIRTRISYMLELQQKRDQGYFRLLPKKDGVRMRDTLNRLEKYFTGMRDMNELPQAIFAIDIGREDICVAEARRLGIKVFAIVDSDCNPNLVDHIIPGNDDAVRSIRLVTNRMASAVLEGLAQREAALQAEMEEMQSMAADALALSPREDEALTDAVELDETTLADLAAGMQARAAAPAPAAPEPRAPAPAPEPPAPAPAPAAPELRAPEPSPEPPAAAPEPPAAAPEPPAPAPAPERPAPPSLTISDAVL
jgi:small subunit ribosomal protein S2